MADTKDFLVGVLVGSAIGAAAALLYAPQAGSETRVMLKDKTSEVMDSAGQIAQQAKGKATEIASQAQTKVGEIKEQATSKIGELKTQATSKVGEISNQAQTLVDRQKEAVKSAVDAGKQAYADKHSELSQDVEEDLSPAPSASTSPSTAS
jgi:gas vesicle protein